MTAGSGDGGRSRYAVGCLLALPGFFGGGMVAVAVGRLVGSLQRCQPPAEGIPACHGVAYLWTGALLGLVLLPGGVLWRMGRTSGAERNSERG